MLVVLLIGYILDMIFGKGTSISLEMVLCWWCVCDSVLPACGIFGTIILLYTEVGFKQHCINWCFVVMFYFVATVSCMVWFGP